MLRVLVPSEFSLPLLARELNAQGLGSLRVLSLSLSLPDLDFSASTELRILLKWNIRSKQEQRFHRQFQRNKPKPIEKSREITTAAAQEEQGQSRVYTWGTSMVPTVIPAMRSALR